MTEAPEGYRLVVRRGRGASSEVWEAVDPDARRVALKLLETDLGEDGRRRFAREHAAMAGLAGHPGIVTIHAAGVHADRPWIAMELCRRGSLATRIAEDGPLDQAAATAVLLRLAGALGAAHAAGIVHSDIKPANVLVTDAGEPVVADFGVARVNVGRATTTTVGGFTLDHVPPELLGDGERSALTDVYSLGTTMFEVLAGRPPFRDANDVSVARVLVRIQTADLPEVPGIGADLMALLRDMTAKDPAARPQSMAEVGERAKAIAGTDEAVVPWSVLPPAAVDLTDDDLATADQTRRRERNRGLPPEEQDPVEPPRRARRGRVLVLTAAVVLVAVGGGAVYLTSQSRAQDTGLAAVQVPATTTSAPTTTVIPTTIAVPTVAAPPTTAQPVAVAPQPITTTRRPAPRTSAAPAAAPAPAPAPVPPPVVIAAEPTPPAARSGTQARQSLRGDITADGRVGCRDKKLVMQYYGGAPTPGVKGDINGDLYVDDADLAILDSNWTGDDTGGC